MTFLRPAKKNDFSLVIILVKLLVLAECYNLDTSPKIFAAPPEIGIGGRKSYFGFSVALYVEKGSDGHPEEAFVLVGAPRANVTSSPGVIESGAVYQCRIRDSSCRLWDLDPTGNGRFNGDRDINQIKDNAWIGATIAVENKTQPRVVVCGPRWKNNIITDKDHWFMNGICYQSLVRNSGAFQREADSRIIPLLGKALQISSGHLKFHNYGMGQTGFALHMVPDQHDETNLLIGNPGVYNWKGVPSLTTFFANGNNRNTIPLIGQEPLINSGDYFGYSVTSGDYFRRKDRWYATGAPRGANIFGRVLIFRFSTTMDRRLIVSKVLNGEQAGEYFGASLASCDINNDGTSEIIIGAPLWSKDMEEGRVYYYVRRNNGEFEPRYIEGETIGGRFGSVVSCLGDLDRDGFEDVAIAAPYQDNRGVVYIYNGNSNDLLKLSQRIRGEDVSRNIRGFGASISEPRDVDGNGYVDLAIGSYLSDHVALFRSRPVVTLTIRVYANVQQLLRNYTFFDVNVCSAYEGYRTPKKLDVERIVKIEDQHGRAFFTDSKYANNSYSLPGTLIYGEKSTFCDRLRINLAMEIQNVIDPIKIRASLILRGNSSEDHYSAGNQGRQLHYELSPLTPVVNEATSKTEDSITLPFAVDCGPDNVCSSILDLSITSDLSPGNRYTLGSETTIKLKINVANRGEAAYKAESHIFVPSPISLGSLPRECLEDSRPDGITEIICALGNPLHDKKMSILELDMRRVPTHIKEISINATITTQSVNLNSDASNRTFTIHFDVDADIALAGKSQDALYSYFDIDKDNETSVETIRFHHIYEVQKFGISPIDESVINVQLPTRWNDRTEIVHIHRIVGQKEGRNFYCSTPNRDSDEEEIEEITDETSIERTTGMYKKSRPFERFTIEETPSLNIPPENRTIYLNCTNPEVECTQISCNLGGFTNSLIVAKLVISLDLRFKNIQREMTGLRDIIFFVSNASVRVQKPEGIVDSIYNKLDSALVGTTFVGSPTKAKIATWIVVLSVIVGLLLLLLLILGLVKLGFFQRKKREQLEALKAESDKNHGFVLETTSSREALDQD